MTDFLSMGGYGPYVWSAYALTFLVLGGLLWQSWRFMRRRERELEVLRGTLTTRSASGRRLQPVRQRGREGGCGVPEESAERGGPR